MTRYSLFLALLIAGTSYGMPQPPGGGRSGQGGPPPGQNGPGGGHGGPSNAVLAAIDADGDHTITADEISNAAAALKKLDTNGDGKLTSDEIHAGEGPGQGGQRPGREGERDGRRSPGGAGEAVSPGGGPGGPPTAEQFMNRAMTFDANSDGVLNKAELQKMATAVIEEMGRRGAPPGGGGPGGDRGGEGSGNRQRPAFDE